MQPNTLTLSTLESHLWEAANILRGSPVDRTDWKSYILPLMFFKRICDVYNEEYQEAAKTSEENLPMNSDSKFWWIVSGTMCVRNCKLGTKLQNAIYEIEALDQNLYCCSVRVWANKDHLLVARSQTCSDIS